MDKESLLDKVKKLLAMANDASLSESLAALYAAKAQALIEEHALEISDLDASDRVLGQFIWVPRYGGDKWRMFIGHHAAPLYMTKMAYTKAPTIIKGRDGNPKVVERMVYILVGEKEHVEVAFSMIEYFIETVERLAKQYSKVRKESDEFAKGCGLRLSMRLAELLEESMSGKKPVAGGANLPALYNNALVHIDDFMKDEMKATPTKRELQVSTDHSANGYLAAEGISINKQVNGARVNENQIEG